MDLKGKRVVVIGGAGLIGSHAVDHLTKTDAREIVIYDNFVRGTMENLEGALRDARIQGVRRRRGHNADRHPRRGPERRRRCVSFCGAVAAAVPRVSTHVDGSAGLGHRRLAIIDLSPLAASR